MQKKKAKTIERLRKERSELRKELAKLKKKQGKGTDEDTEARLQQIVALALGTTGAGSVSMQ